MPAVAFHRSDAMDTLEDLVYILMVHLRLLSKFPEDGAAKHWQREENAFGTTLSRYNRGKKGRYNYVSPVFIESIIHEKLKDPDEQKRIEMHIASKGYEVSVEEIDWENVKQKASAFAKTIFPGVTI